MIHEDPVSMYHRPAHRGHGFTIAPQTTPGGKLAADLVAAELSRARGVFQISGWAIWEILGTAHYCPTSRPSALRTAFSEISGF